MKTLEQKLNELPEDRRRIIEREVDVISMLPEGGIDRIGYMCSVAFEQETHTGIKSISIELPYMAENTEYLMNEASRIMDILSSICRDWNKRLELQGQ